MKTQFLSIPNQTSVTTNFHNLQNTETQPRSNKWNVGEDIILTSSRRIASQNRVRDKKQKNESLWARVKALYGQAHVENLGKIGNKKNMDQMRGCYNRLSENAQK